MPKKKIDWLNHSLEFMVVIIGILLAFQLNKCSETRTQNQLLDNHMEYIETECKDNVQRLKEGTTHITGQLQVVDSLIEGIVEKKDVNLIRSLSAKLLDLRNVEVKKDAYSVLVESGDIRFLTNFNQKRKIITLYEEMDGVEGVNKNSQNLYDNHFYPYLKKNFDLVSWDYIKSNNEAAIAPYYSQEFGNIISTYRFLLLTQRKVYQEAEAALNNYLSN